MVKTINRLLNEEGYTIKGARKFLASRRKGPEMVEDAPQAAAASLPLMTGDAPDNGVILAELKAIRDRLSHALDAA